jgi:ubiquinone/menaquinone biosynthesis C-methylase UbiE
MFEGSPEKDNKRVVVNELWSNGENRDLIGRDFSLYAETLKNAGISEENFLEILSKGKVLDVACGEGGFVSGCLERGIDAYGIDLALSEQENIGRLGSEKKLTDDIRGRLIAGDATHLPFADGTFKTIFNQAGAFSYAHGPEEIAGILHEQLRVASEGGKIIINPVEIYGMGFCPINFSNAYLEKEKRQSDEEIESINSAFNDEVKKLVKKGRITVDLFENEKYERLDRGTMHGVAIITKQKMEL